MPNLSEFLEEFKDVRENPADWMNYLHEEDDFTLDQNFDSDLVKGYYDKS